MRRLFNAQGRCVELHVLSCRPFKCLLGEFVALDCHFSLSEARKPEVSTLTDWFLKALFSDRVWNITGLTEA